VPGPPGVTTTGALQTTAVNRALVQSATSADRNLALAASAVSCLVGALVTTCVALSATVKHPLYLYFLIAALLPLLIVSGIALRVTWKQSGSARAHLDNPPANDSILVTYTFGDTGGLATTAPRTAPAPVALAPVAVAPVAPPTQALPDAGPGSDAADRPPGDGVAIMTPDQGDTADAMHDDGGRAEAAGVEDDSG
jgi:hypothetical protein